MAPPADEAGAREAEARGAPSGGAARARAPAPAAAAAALGRSGAAARLRACLVALKGCGALPEEHAREADALLRAARGGWADVSTHAARALVAGCEGRLAAMGLAFPTQRDVDAHAKRQHAGRQHAQQGARGTGGQDGALRGGEAARARQEQGEGGGGDRTDARNEGGARAGGSAADVDALADALGGALALEEGQRAGGADTLRPGASRVERHARAEKESACPDADGLASMLQSSLLLDGRPAKATTHLEQAAPRTQKQEKQEKQARQPQPKQQRQPQPQPVRTKPSGPRLCDAHASLDALFSQPPRRRPESARRAPLGVLSPNVGPRSKSAPGELQVPRGVLQDAGRDAPGDGKKASEAARAEAELRRLRFAAELGAPLADGRSLYAYQRTAVVELLQRKRCVLAYDMGLGKTLISLVAARAWQRTCGAAVAVLAPKAMLEGWRREAAAAAVRVGVHSWAKVPAEKALGLSLDVEGTGQPFVLIADEAHYMQSPRAARTKAALALAASPRCVACILVTGTPMRNGAVANLVPLLQAARQRKLVDDPKEFVRRYKNDLGALRQATCHVVLRRTKEQCLDLPPKTRVRVDVEPSPTDRARYAEAVAQARRRRAEGGGEGAALALLTAVRQAASEAKAGAALEVCSELLAQGRSVVIFVAYLSTVDALAEGLEKLGTTALRVVGGQSARERQQAVDTFQKPGGPPRAVVCTFGAGGVGLTLTRASDVVLVDRPWTAGDAVQAEDRVHRIGTTAPVTALWLSAFDIDRHVDKQLLVKRSNAERAVDGRKGGSGGGDSGGGSEASAKALAARVAALVLGR